MKVLDRDGATSALFALGFRLVDSASLLETVRVLSTPSVLVFLEPGLLVAGLRLGSP